MFAEQRYEMILAELQKHGAVTVTDISEKLNVSAETVRRDLILLETHGKLRRVFGGAVQQGAATHREPLEKRLAKNTDQKIELSRYAAAMIDEGDVIAVDAGSTVYELCRVLRDSFENLTVITYCDAVFRMLNDKFRVILCGGEYNRENESFTGPLAVEFLQNLHVNKSFVFPWGLSVANGLEIFETSFVPLHRTLMHIADRTFVLADNSKFSARALLKVCDLDPEHIYVTDSGVSRSVRDEFEANGLVLICGENNDEHAER